MALASFILKPVLGLKTNVPMQDATLLQPLGENVAASHCVEGSDFIRVTAEKGSTTKAAGKTLWSNTATASAQTCLGMFELNDGSARTHWMFMGDNASNGRIFRYDGSRDPVRISDVDGHSGAVEFAFANLSKYCVINYGGMMIFCDNASHTPYCADYNDVVVKKLISTGTEYKPKFIEIFQNRIIAAHMDSSALTNGDISIIWSGLLPTPGTTCTFGTGDPPSNHLFRPNDDVITGIKRFNQNVCLLYGENSIDSIDYYPNYQVPFAIRNLVPNQGATNNQSIVSTGSAHYFFNSNYGFCAFVGGGQFPAGGRPISEPIEDVVSSIARTYYGHIVGAFLPHINSIAWTVPLYGSATPTHLLLYHIPTGSWTVDERVVWWIDNWVTDTAITWEKLLLQGYETWDDIADLRWSDIVSENPYIMISSTDGHTYSLSGTSNADADYTGVRIEPVLDFFRPNDKDLLLEIWFGITATGDYSVNVWYRGGNTGREAATAAWESLGSFSCDNPANAVIYCHKLNRYHQIKYGTTAAGEPFGINEIEFKFAPQGRY